MPPKTKKQARFLWKNKPSLMRRWRKAGKAKPTGGRKKKK